MQVQILFLQKEGVERGILILVMRGWVVGQGEDRSIVMSLWSGIINEDAERKPGKWYAVFAFSTRCEASLPPRG